MCMLAYAGMCIDMCIMYNNVYVSVRVQVIGFIVPATGTTYGSDTCRMVSTSMLAARHAWRRQIPGWKGPRELTQVT